MQPRIARCKCGNTALIGAPGRVFSSAADDVCPTCKETTINPDRLAQLGTITLDKGAHRSFKQGHCAMEVVSWLAGEGFTDAPECASPVLRAFTIGLNDDWDDTQRQKLVPYLTRMIGTAGDGQDEARSLLALDWLIRTYADLASATDAAARSAARSAAWEAAWEAADATLNPTVETLQNSALDLLDRMIDPSKEMTP